MWSRSFFSTRFAASANNHAHKMRSRQSIRPILEVLETRLAPATQVFNPADMFALINDLQAAANAPNDTTIINLKAGVTYTLTLVNNYWYGPNGLPAIDSNVIIHGNGATIARDANPADNTPNFRLFYVSGGLELPPGSLTMDNVTLEGGIAKGGDSGNGGGGMGAGGAIFNQGTLNLTGVTLTNNKALGGNSGVAADGPSANGGGGIGANAPSGGNGGGFGGGFNASYGGSGGKGATTGADGGGGGLLAGADGARATGSMGGAGGGKGGFGGSGGSNTNNTGGSGGDGGGGGGIGDSDGGNFGIGGGTGGGGGGVGGGGGAGGVTDLGGGGGFGGGGGYSGGSGGFGGGGGGSNTGIGGSGGFGGGSGLGEGGGGAGLGGAIFNMGADSADAGSGQATLVNCTLTANSAQGGSGGTGNGAGGGGDGFGGALFNLDGTVALTNDTLDANNVAYGTGFGTGLAYGGAVYNLLLGQDIDTGKAASASLVLHNSILADSSTNDLIDGASDLANGIFATGTVSGSNNLVMNSRGSIPSGVIALAKDPNLGQLQNNGGLTPTMLPGAGSPVLGLGAASLAPATDQRGQPRPPDGPTDLGSVQVSVGSMTGTSSSSGGSSSSGTPISAGFVGLAIEEFELTIDTILDMVEGMLGKPHADLDATIAQLQSAIANDPLTPSSTGQMAVLLGQSLALKA